MKSTPNPEEAHDEARTLSACERACCIALMRAARVGSTCRYLGVSLGMLDRIIPGPRTLRAATVARIRERIGPGAYFTPNARGDA